VEKTGIKPNPEDAPIKGVSSKTNLSDTSVDVSFDQRKKDHLSISLDQKVQAKNLRDLDKIELLHEALPDLDLETVQTNSDFFGKTTRVPFFISSMTAGHKDGESLNRTLARAAQKRGWAMGVGSQRKQLFDAAAAEEWQRLRDENPEVILFGNIGIAQLIRSPMDQILRLAEEIKASGFYVHLNALQEALQEEGTPQFAGGMKALKEFVQLSSAPVIVKETGCGMSKATLEKLFQLGIQAVDVAGAGGTHWGRVEGQRSKRSLLQEVSETFKNWGIGTLKSVENALEVRSEMQLNSKNLKSSEIGVWASGGIRNGLDAAAILAFGADRVGFAQSVLEAAVLGEEELLHWMSRTEVELQIALFCTGCCDIDALKTKKVWQWKSHQ